MEDLNIDFNREIHELLYRQQVLESLKTNHQNGDFLSNAYAENIIFQCRHKTTPGKLLKTIPAAAFIAVNCLFTITILFFILISILLFGIPDLLSGNFRNDSVAKRMLESPYANEAEIAMRNGDYDTARSILTEKMAASPYGAFFFIDYSILCQLEGNQDEAAMTMVNFLNNSYFPQNIQSSQNLIYMRLTELTGPFSPDVQRAYQECIAACQQSMENFASLDSFMENEEYQLALQLCNSMQHENTRADLLCLYYYTCYTNLGEYEKCAAYFLNLAEECQLEGYPYLLLPSITIKDKLTELKPYVSTETQQKIDDACQSM